MVDFHITTGSDGRSIFEQMLAERFPAIAADIGECERGLLHMEIGLFATATRDAIHRGDQETVRSHLSFVDELFGMAAAGLENAICVSYLENVFLGENGARYTITRQLLSARLEQAILEVEEHWTNIR